MFQFRLVLSLINFKILFILFVLTFFRALVVCPTAYEWVHYEELSFIVVCVGREYVHMCTYTDAKILQKCVHSSAGKVLF